LAASSALRVVNTRVYCSRAPQWSGSGGGRGKIMRDEAAHREVGEGRATHDDYHVVSWGRQSCLLGVRGGARRRHGGATGTVQSHLRPVPIAALCSLQDLGLQAPDGRAAQVFGQAVRVQRCGVRVGQLWPQTQRRWWPAHAWHVSEACGGGGPAWEVGRDVPGAIEPLCRTHPVRSRGGTHGLCIM
jgi:hypothetical protein